MVFCCIYGVTVVSMIIVTITNTLQHDSKERKAFIILEKLTINDQMRDKASHIMGLVGKLSLKKTIETPEKRQDAIESIKQYKKEFLELKREYKNIGDLEIADQQELEFAFVDNSLDDLNSKMVDMIMKNKQRASCMAFYMKIHNKRLKDELDELKFKQIKAKTSKNLSALKSLLLNDKRPTKGRNRGATTLANMIPLNSMQSIPDLDDNVRDNSRSYTHFRSPINKTLKHGDTIKNLTKTQPIIKSKRRNSDLRGVKFREDVKFS